MIRTFNPPPNWPRPPAGWTPPPGWRPDTTWPVPPAGWQLWIDRPPAGIVATVPAMRPAPRPIPAAPVMQAAPRVASYTGITLYGDSIGKGRERYPLAGVTASMEQGSELEKRITATRLVMLGVFALAAKKSKGGEWFLTIEGPRFTWVVEVPRKEIGKARKFAGQVSSQVKSSTPAFT